jgi:hypothetical protein
MVDHDDQINSTQNGIVCLIGLGCSADRNSSDALSKTGLVDHVHLTSPSGQYGQGRLLRARILGRAWNYILNSMRRRLLSATIYLANKDAERVSRLLQFQSGENLIELLFSFQMYRHPPLATSLSMITDSIDSLAAILKNPDQVESYSDTQYALADDITRSAIKVETARSFKRMGIEPIAVIMFRIWTWEI